MYRWDSREPRETSSFERIEEETRVEVPLGPGSPQKVGRTYGGMTSGDDPLVRRTKRGQKTYPRGIEELKLG